MRLEPHRLVFIDETGTTTKMTRLRGRAPRGERLKMHVPFGHWHTQTFVAGLRCDGLTAPWVLDGPMNRRTFEVYVETQLAPTLSRDDIVIMDNLSPHKGPRVTELIQDCGAWPLFLPPYSPDLNPIERAFAKLKELLRKRGARTSKPSGRPSAISARSSRRRNAGTSFATTAMPVTSYEAPML